MARVIIVSNRLPVSVAKVDGKLEFGRSVGGVATGLSSYMTNPNNRWIGWPGIASDELTEDEKQQVTRELRKHNCSPVFLTKKQIDEFYNGYSNSIIWPLFHNLPFKDSPQHERWWRAYRAVNKMYAEAVAAVADSDSSVWVHDYHLMLLPEYIRRARTGANIGFFMHIPFPDPKSYAKLTEARRLVIGMLGADLIGFHTTSYVAEFLQNCDELKIGTPGDEQLILGTRSVRVTDFPMGIDYEKYATASKLPEVRREVARMRRRYKGMQIIASVERLDISKGYVERLQAYRQFLATHPKMRGKVVFVLVGAPSRSDLAAYKRLSNRVDKLAKEINQEFGTAKWQPLDYINEVMPFEQVSALNQIADVAFVAPLRDGMNLTPKEFVASKRGAGVVILSDTAGAAEDLQDALLVSHRQPESLVNALDQALNMQRREMRRRLRNMQSQLSANTVQHWAGSFMKNLQKPIPGTPVMTHALNDGRRRELVAAYRGASKRLILLDYDGTLVPLAENYKHADPPKSVIGLLEKLAAPEANDVVLISGRSQPDLQRWFGGLRIHLVAEHGAIIKSAGHQTWRETVETGRRWKKTVRPILAEYAALTPGAKVEEKQFSLVWHYRGAPAYYAQKYAVVIQRVLKPVAKAYGLSIFNGSKILEIKDPNITKGRAIGRWLKRPHDFVLALGDDFTDEDTFRALPDDAYSIKVGRGRSHAKYRLTNSGEVQKLLKQLGR